MSMRIELITDIHKESHARHRGSTCQSTKLAVVRRVVSRRPRSVEELRTRPHGNSRAGSRVALMTIIGSLQDDLHLRAHQRDTDRLRHVLPLIVRFVIYSLR